MDADSHFAQVALLAFAVSAAATTTALLPLLANPAHAQPAAVRAPAAPTATASAVPAKGTLPTAGASLPPVNASLPTVTTSPGPVQVTLPPVGVSVGPIQATPGPVTVSLPPVSGSLPSAATPARVGSSGPSGPNGLQTGGPFPPPPLAYKPHPGDTPAATPDTGAAHGVDSLLASLLNLTGPGAGLTPDAHLGLAQIPGVGSDGVLGRQSVTAPALSDSSPAMPRAQVVLAVLAILALSIVTAEYARSVLLRQRQAG